MTDLESTSSSVSSDVGSSGPKPNDAPSADQRVALVVGATGMVGLELVRQLMDDDTYDLVRTFTRRPLELTNPRLESRVVDFSQMDAIRPLLTGEVLFSCLGTTIRAAKTKEAQWAVDHDLQLRLANEAAKGGVPAYVLVSSTGADPKSLSFYLRMKGQLELAVAASGFESVRILRPGALDGDRAESRPGEQFFLGLARHLPRWSSLARVRPIHASTLARAARVAAQDWTPGVEIIEADRLFALGEK